jgi:hypothetical protein
MSIRKFGLLFVFVLLIALPGWGVDYYVSASEGNDGYNGLWSYDKHDGTNGPWKTVTHAFGTMGSGNTLYILPGTYDNANGEGPWPLSPANNATVIGSGPAQSIIGPDTAGGSIIEFKGDGTLQNCEIIKTGDNNNAAIIMGTSAATISDCLIHNNDPATQHKGAGIKTWGSGSGGDIINNTILYFGAGIWGASPGGVSTTTISKNVIGLFDQAGVYISAGDSASIIYKIKNNIIGKSIGVAADITSGYGIGITDDDPYIEVMNNNFYGNQGAVEGGTADVYTNNIAAFSQIKKPWDPTENDAFDLYSASPNIGAGEGGINIGKYQGGGIGASPYSSTVYVDGVSGDDNNPGTSSLPVKTIARGIEYTTEPGQTIVRPATYTPTARIDVFANRSLLGDDRETTIIQGDNDRVVQLTSGCTFSGFTVTNSNAGLATRAAVAVYATNADNVDVRDNIVYGTVDPIYNAGIVTNASTAEVEYNEVRNFTAGIVGWKTGQARHRTIYANNNTVVNNLYGIVSYMDTVYATNNIVCGSTEGTIQTGSYGIYNHETITGEAHCSYNNAYNSENNYYQITSGPNPGAMQRDALFVDAAKNFQLSASSPCIGAGIRGEDLGAWPFTGTTTTTTITPTTTSTTTTTLGIIGNPYVTGSGANISLAVNTNFAGSGTYALYDLNWNTVVPLTGATFTQGVNTINLGKYNLSPGVYILRIEIGQIKRTKKIIVP